MEHQQQAYDFYNEGLRQVHKHEPRWKEIHCERFWETLQEESKNLPTLEGNALLQAKNRIYSYTLFAHMIGPACLKQAALNYQQVCDMMN